MKAHWDTRRYLLFVFAPVFLLLAVFTGAAQTAQPSPAPQRSRSHEPSHADILRGAYGQYRANNDLLFYHLDIRVDPEKKLVSGKNTIRFKMLKDDMRIQLDLDDALKIEKILLGK